MKKYIQKIVTILTALSLALIVFPSKVYADIAPEPPLPSNEPNSVAGIIIVILVIVVAAASIIILKKIKNK